MTLLSTGDKILLGNLTANGSTDGTIVNFRTDLADIEFSGSFGGGTVTLERESNDGSTWIQERDSAGTVVSVNTSEIVRISLPYGAKIRATIAGSTSPDLKVWIKRVRRGS